MDMGNQGRGCVIFFNEFLKHHHVIELVLLRKAMVSISFSLCYKRPLICMVFLWPISSQNFVCTLKKRKSRMGTMVLAYLPTCSYHSPTFGIYLPTFFIHVHSYVGFFVDPSTMETAASGNGGSFERSMVQPVK